MKPLHTFEILGEVEHGCFRRSEGMIRVVQNLAYAKQVHGADVIEVRPGEVGLVGEGDALIISQPGQAVMVKHADCQAALFYDPVEKVAAAVHSGWRGSVQNIYRVVVEHLRAAHRCRPENLLVGISPSLGPQKAEFVNFRTELPEPFWEYQVRPNYFDFWEISRRQLEVAGLLPHHIEIAGICTYSNPDDWFSYRRDRTTDRNGTVIQL